MRRRNTAIMSRMPSFGMMILTAGAPAALSKMRVLAFDSTPERPRKKWKTATLA
jgi:hypothetical protein